MVVHKDRLGASPLICLHQMPDLAHLGLLKQSQMTTHNTNNGSSLMRTLVYFKGKARNWLHQHPHLYAFYKANKFRLITSPLRGLPDFVIIGAMKSGTTSLYDFLIKNPAIASASKKELHYFSLRHNRSKLWYCSNFPSNLSRHYFYKKTNQRLLSGEASPIYLFYPLVPGRMKKTLPDVKLIVILRNPVDRAYSHYHHSLRSNVEPMSFEKAVELEGERCAGEREQLIRDPNFIPKHYRDHSYLARGVYADQLENWFKHYDRKQFLILTTEDFHENPQQTLDQVFDFLGVHPFQVGSLKNRNVGNYKEMNEDTRKFLIEYFKPHNERLSKLLQRSFDWDR